MIAREHPQDVGTGFAVPPVSADISELAAEQARSSVSAAHVPVMLAEAVAALAPRDGGVYVDCTFGGGGYSAALLAAADCRVWAIDRDPTAVALAHRLAAEQGGRLGVIKGCFGDLSALLNERGVTLVDGVVFDLGVSSSHLDDAGRGFSFRFDGPLDMRMGATGETAADLVNHLSEHELARLIFDYGEERRARRVAGAIVAARAEAPIERTGRLASIVRSAVPSSHDGLDPATRTFQALRMAVNDEPGELRRGLTGAENMLAPGGRLAVVSFHSLEDRVVKEFLRLRSELPAAPSRHLPGAFIPAARPVFSFRLLDRRPSLPSPAEIVSNPRSRSAKLRAAERTDAPPFVVS